LKLKKNLGLIALACSLCAVLAAAQAPATPQGAAQGPAPAQGTAQASAGGRGGRAGRGGGVPAYPQHAQADPASIARGKMLFGVNCSFCHGSDARGGEGGPNLIRSQLVMDDQHGEAIAVVVQNGRADKGMPKFDLTTANVTDIAAFIHSVPSSGHDAVREAPATIVVGDANAGQAFFNGPGKCSSCHSVSGDLAGIGSKMEPKDLQNALVSGGGGGRGAAPSPAAQMTVKVTLPSGEVVQGKLDRVDDFYVSLVEANGTHRSFRRNGDIPKVELTNPLQAHLNMLGKITDDQIHNLTAYLVTVK
jgi:cytochrome c oxidase cbb3-type subunit 3